MKTRKRSKLNTTPKGFVALCVLPALSGVLFFLIYPTINAIRMSFTNAASLAAGTADFVFLDNYIRMFTNDAHFMTALRNTLQLLAVVPTVAIFLALVLAFGLTQAKLKEKGVYRVLFFVPHIISLVVVAVVFSALFHPRSTGPINMLLGVFGLDPIVWLGDPTWAIWAITIVMVWQAVGYYMVLLIAAIDGISKDIFEAADIDGASAPRKFFCITIPLLLDNIGIVYMLALASTMNISFLLGMVMTSFGPGTATLVLPGHMHNMAFGPAASFGYAMAIMVFTLGLALVFAIISRKLTARRANI